MIKKIYSAIIMLFLLVGSGSIIAAEIQMENEIASIPAKISDIYNCGSWKTSEDEGIYRIVYVEFHFGNSLLYIQWVKDFTPDDPTRHVLHTLSIDEFNANDHIELTFNKPECIETENGIRFKIVAHSGHDGKKHVFDLQVSNEFGKYSIKELPEKTL